MTLRVAVGIGGGGPVEVVDVAHVHPVGEAVRLAVVGPVVRADEARDRPVHPAEGGIEPSADRVAVVGGVQVELLQGGGGPVQRALVHLRQDLADPGADRGVRHAADHHGAGAVVQEVALADERHPAAVAGGLVGEGQADVLDVVLALQQPGGGPGLLDGGGHQRDQHRDDRNDHQQFDQREPAAGGRPGGRRGVGETGGGVHRCGPLRSRGRERTGENGAWLRDEFPGKGNLPRSLGAARRPVNTPRVNATRDRPTNHTGKPRAADPGSPRPRERGCGPTGCAGGK